MVTVLHHVCLRIHSYDLQRAENLIRPYAGRISTLSDSDECRDQNPVLADLRAEDSPEGPEKLFIDGLIEKPAGLLLKGSSLAASRIGSIVSAIVSKGASSQVLFECGWVTRKADQ